MDYEHQLIRKIENYCRENALLPDGTTVICACSGGPDSMALLDILLRLREHMAADGKILKVAAAHFEHGIRGKISLADAGFVNAFCRERNIEIYMGSGDVPAEAKRTGESLETAARRLRYEFLYSVSHELDGALIATAHHADDQAETVLMHMLRGSGTNGLGGIRPRNGLLIRPLLCVSKEQLVSYCHGRNIEFRMDATNDIPDCFRNKIRLELLPILKKEYNTNIVQALNRLAKSSAEDEAFLQGETDRVWASIVLADASSLEGNKDIAEKRRCILISRRRLLDTTPAIQSRILQKIAFILTEKALERVHIETLIRWLACGETGTVLEMPFGIRARRQYEKIYFYVDNCVSRRAAIGKAGKVTGMSKEAETVEAAMGVKKIKVAEAIEAAKGMVKTNTAEYTETAENEACTCRLEYAILDYRPEGSFGIDTILCDADRLAFPLSIRTRRPGDVIQLSAGRKKLKDFFIDIKLPRDRRDSQPLVVSGDTIIWLPGLRQAKVAWIDANTKRYAVISYKSV